MPQYFDGYIGLVADVELSRALEDSIRQLDSLDKNLLAELGGKRYAPDKWTVKGILQHVIDWERILSYRTLLFARREGAVSQGVCSTKNPPRNSQPSDVRQACGL